VLSIVVVLRGLRDKIFGIIIYLSPNPIITIISYFKLCQKRR
jgi:hypothetical protein